LEISCLLEIILWSPSSHDHVLINEKQMTIGCEENKNKIKIKIKCA
jgi:hypothetical protein